MTIENAAPVSPGPSTPPDKRAAAIAALNAADPPEPRGETVETETPEAAEPAPKAAKPAKAEEHEVKATPEQEIKAKARASLARAEAESRKIAEAKSEFEKWQAEQRQSIDGERAKFKEEIAGLRKLAQEDPEKFLEALGWDLNGLVKTKLEQGKPEAVTTKLERQLAELQAQLVKDRDALQKEREAAQSAAQEREQAAIRHQTEQQFITVAGDAGKYGLVAKMVKKNPAMAIRNAYIVRDDLMRENGGKMPFHEDIAARLETELQALRDEAEPAAVAADDDFTDDKPKPKSKISPKASAQPKSVKPLREMTDREKRLAAIAAFNETYTDDD